MAYLRTLFSLLTLRLLLLDVQKFRGAGNKRAFGDDLR